MKDKIFYQVSKPLMRQFVGHSLEHVKLFVLLWVGLAWVI